MTVKKMIPVLAGGGTRLPAHVGILSALEQLDYQVDQLVGVSGGSIVASLFAYGHSTAHLKKLAFDVDFRQFRGFSIKRLMRCGGLSDGSCFENWLDNQLHGATFADLERDLHVVATDVRSGEPVIFDREHTPDFTVSRAVRFSMGIPLLFTFEKYRNHLMVDGSILAEDALYRSWTDDDTPVVYFRLRSAKENVPIEESRVFPLPDYVTMLIRTFMTSISREYIHDRFWRNTVVIETSNVSPIEFAMTAEQKLDLFERGFETTRSVLPLKLNGVSLPDMPVAES